MDGTLVDTEPYWMVAETELVTSFGGRWSHEDGMQMVGLGLWNSASILQAAGVDLDADTIVERLTSRVQDQLVETGVPWRPGARELLAAVRAEGMPTALVTMSVGRMATQLAETVGFDAFDVIIAGDMVTNAKPDPEAYLRAAELLGVQTRDCVAIEDSVPGLAAAVASGAVTIGVPHMVPLAEGDADVLWPSLEGRTAADITAVYTSTRKIYG